MAWQGATLCGVPCQLHSGPARKPGSLSRFLTTAYRTSCDLRRCSISAARTRINTLSQNLMWRACSCVFALVRGKFLLETCVLATDKEVTRPFEDSRQIDSVSSEPGSTTASILCSEARLATALTLSWSSLPLAGKSSRPYERCRSRPIDAQVLEERCCQRSWYICLSVTRREPDAKPKQVDSTASKHMEGGSYALGLPVVDETCHGPSPKLASPETLSSFGKHNRIFHVAFCRCWGPPALSIVSIHRE